jgi:hypothetical protein
MSTSYLDIISSLAPEDRNRAQSALADLAFYARGRYSLVGGLPIRYFLAKAGKVVPHRPFNDIDLIAEGAEAFHPSLVESFLIHHFHDGSPGRDFRFVLVHKKTNTKIDIFNELLLNGVVGEVNFGRGRLPIQSLESQLAKTVYDLATMHHRAPIDPKQFADAAALMGIADLKKAGALFELQLPQGPTLGDAFLEAQDRAANNPESVADKPWQSKPPYQCSKCYPSSPDWPLADMDEVYNRLGYIELDGANML